MIIPGMVLGQIPGVTLKVLLADDDPVSLKILQMALRPEGYEITAVSNGSDAWRLIEDSNPPAIAVIDWMMPDMDGISLCRKLRQLDSRRQSYTYVLLVTARGDSDDIVQGLRAGADDYLVKPLNLSELRARVQVGRRIVDLQKELLARNHMLEDYNAAVSHDLKTPLIAVRMTLEQVVEGLYGPVEKPVGVVLSRSRDSVAELLSMCDTILSLAKYGSDDVLTGTSKVEMLSLVRDAGRDLKPLFDRYEVKLVIDAAGPSYLVTGVELDLKRLFVNLLDNAARFAETGSSVTVRLRLSPDRIVRVSIANTGSEIPEQARRALFVRFSEIAGGGAKPGTGLGLYLCRRILERHGGRIWYEHDLASGSQFIFEIPAVTNASS